MTLQEATRIVEEHLNYAAECFKPGTKITFFARTPGNDNADFVLTNDTKTELAKLVERIKE